MNKLLKQKSDKTSQKEYFTKNNKHKTKQITFWLIQMPYFLPLNISRFPGGPGIFSTSKPAEINALLTSPLAE